MRKILPLLGLVLGLSACTTVGSSREVYDLPGATGELPFSHVIAVGDTVYVAGTLGLDPETRMPPADPAAEARLLLDEFQAKLALVDLEMDDLVSVQVFCSDVSLYATFNDVYRTYFDSRFPTRSFIGSGPLLRGCRFEVNGIAAR